MSQLGSWCEYTITHYGGFLGVSGWTNKPALDGLVRLAEAVSLMLQNRLNNQSPRTFQLGDVHYPKFDEMVNGGQIKWNSDVDAFMVITADILLEGVSELPSLTSVLRLFRTVVKNGLRELGITKYPEVQIVNDRIEFRTNEEFTVAIKPVF